MTTSDLHHHARAQEPTILLGLFPVNYKAAKNNHMLIGYASVVVFAKNLVIIVIVHRQHFLRLCRFRLSSNPTVAYVKSCWITVQVRHLFPNRFCQLTEGLSYGLYRKVRQRIINLSCRPQIVGAARFRRWHASGAECTSSSIWKELGSQIHRRKRDWKIDRSFNIWLFQFVQPCRACLMVLDL